MRRTLSLDETPLLLRVGKTFDELLQLRIAELEEEDQDEFTRAELANPYLKYQNDPIGFCSKELGATFTEDIEDLMVSAMEYPVIQVRSANATGKTHGLAHLIVWFYKCHPFAQVYTFAAPPEDNLRLLLWGEINAIIERNPHVFEEERSNLTGKMTGMHVQRRSKVFITGVTIPATGTPAQREARFSGKHAPWLMFVGDEADALPYEVFRGVETCVSGGETLQIYAFNPRAPEGPMWDMENDRTAHVVQLSAFTHPNVITGEDKIPGAVTQETTVRRINEWTRAVTEGERIDKECFEVPEFLVGKQAMSAQKVLYPPLPAGYRRVMNPSFYTIVLGLYPRVIVNQLVHPEWVDRARANYDAYVAKHGELPPVAIDPIAGQDVGELGTDLSALCVRYGHWVAPLWTWGGVDPVVTSENADKYLRALRPSAVNVDSTGVGSAVAPLLKRKGYKAHRVMVVSKPDEQNNVDEGEFAMVRDWIFWRMREWLRTNEHACLPPDKELVEEILKLKYAIVRGYVVVTSKDDLRHLLRRSPDRLDAFALTFYDEDLKTGEVRVSNYRTNQPVLRQRKIVKRKSVRRAQR